MVQASPQTSIGPCNSRCAGRSLLSHLLLPSSSPLLLRCPISSPVAAPFVCSSCPCLSSCLLPPLVSRSHHRLSTVALHYLSAGRCHQTIASRLFPKLSLHHLLSAAIVSSCLPPLHSLMADCQVVVCRPLPPNHPLSSAAKAVVASSLISSRCLLAGSARCAVI